MDMFIKKGVLPTYNDTFDQTALYYAAREGQNECVELLLKNGTL